MPDTVRTARKAHRCHSCGSVTRVGDTYLDRRRRKQMGEAIRLCLRCIGVEQVAGQQHRDEDEQERWHREALDTIPDKDWL